MAEIGPREYYKQNFRVTSEYGWRDGRMHEGVDLGRGRFGDPVLSINPGVVKTSGYSATAGNWMVVEQDDGTTAKYMHMQNFPFYMEGDRVERGAEIGKIGSTGRSSGPHLHLGVYYQGKPIEPLKYMEEGLRPFIEEDLETLEGRKNAALDFFLDRGYTKNAAIGIVGNLISESGLDVKAKKIDDIESSYGIAQWNSKGAPDRVENFEKEFGKSLGDATFMEQLEFVDWEINNYRPFTNKDLYGQLNGEGSLNEVTGVFTRIYENPADIHKTPEAIAKRAKAGQTAWASKKERMLKEEAVWGGKYDIPEGWATKEEDLPENINYVSKYTREGQVLRNLNEEESLEERLTSLENRDENAMFVEYIRGRDEREEREKSEKAAEEEKRAQASAAEKLLREETKKRKFLMNFAMESLDYQAPEYRRVGNQQNREQNS